MVAMAMMGWIVLVIVNVDMLKLRVKLSVIRWSMFIVVAFLKGWMFGQTTNVGWLRLIVGVMRWSVFSVVAFMKGWMVG